MKKHFFSASLRLCVMLLASTAAAVAQTVPSPKDVLGWTPGDDRKLASWAQVVEFFKKLDAASDRVKFEEIGKSTMGAPFVYATISSPENIKNLEKYKKINAQLADPRTFKSNDKAAQRLIKEGKTIVLITCGVHSTEVGSYLSSMLIAHQLAIGTTPDIKNILDNTILLLVPSLNPDGVDIVNNWYQKTLGTKFEGTDPPELYHKYVGHDDNRDWYAFTQVETQLTVDKIHNVWHPQIVHDIHQQGANGSRLFLPPYMQPVEPNVPKQIVEGYTELGNAIAADMRAKGFQGITTNSTYDAWTPARAYSHYHGGVRILSETASCKLATPITVKFDELRPGEGYDPKKVTDNFGPLWMGGEWHLRNITDYMTTAANALLFHAATNREQWLSRFYQIGKEAVRVRKDGELSALVIDPMSSRYDYALTPILERAGVEIERLDSAEINGKSFPRGAVLIRMNQPYGNFVKALLEKQVYPNLLDKDGHPIPPYDVTSHTLSLLMQTRVESLLGPLKVHRLGGGVGMGIGTGIGSGRRCSANLRIGLYKFGPPSMDEGWSRWVFTRHSYFFDNVGFEKQFCNATTESVVRSEVIDTKDLNKFHALVFPDQSPNQILNGYAKGSMPDEYTGGVGKEGVENLKKFVEAGGTLVFLNRSSNFAIEQFGLPLRDVTKGLARKDFYIPGSILRTELDTTNPIANGMPQESIAWFESGPVFEIIQPPGPPAGVDGDEMKRPTSIGDVNGIKVIARYPADPAKILLSGWALGADRIAGRAALVQVNIGRGKIILFGFRPQYRGQSLATFPLLFNAISQ